MRRRDRAPRRPCCRPQARVKGPLADRKAFLQGVDHEGRGVVIVRVRNHLSANRDIREMRLFSAYIIDALVALADKTRNPGCRVVCMFDMTGGSMANMDVPCMKTILGLLSTHYVERLSTFYFYNPPRVFWGLWTASKHLLPEVGRPPGAGAGRARRRGRPACF